MRIDSPTSDLPPESDALLRSSLRRYHLTDGIEQDAQLGVTFLLEIGAFLRQLWARPKDLT